MQKKKFYFSIYFVKIRNIFEKRQNRDFFDGCSIEKIRGGYYPQKENKEGIICLKKGSP